ncbi:MAG: hypothetical protein ACKO8I_19020 [Cyanobacteriota bacterium]
MSYLREIMQRLNAASAGQAAGQAAGADPWLGLHSQHYAEQLSACSEAMLRYELAWLEQHRETLELCRVQPDMLQVAGGERHLEQMLQESEHSSSCWRLRSPGAASAPIPIAMRWWPTSTPGS